MNIVAVAVLWKKPIRGMDVTEAHLDWWCFGSEAPLYHGALLLWWEQGGGRCYFNITLFTGADTLIYIAVCLFAQLRNVCFANVFLFASWRVQGCDAPRLEREREPRPSPGVERKCPVCPPSAPGLDRFSPRCVVAYCPHTADVWHDIHGIHWTLYQLESSLRTFVYLVYS